MTKPTPMPTLSAVPPSAIDDLTDEIWEAICNEQDMDTSLMDFAKAIVRDVPLVKAAPDLLAALEGIRADLDKIDSVPLGEVSKFLDAMARKLDAAIAGTVQP